MKYGQVAYEGYFAACDGKSLISGAPLPKWEDQAVAIQNAWGAAAAAVRDAHKAVEDVSR